MELPFYDPGSVSFWVVVAIVIGCVLVVIFGLMGALERDRFK
jgi:hypothetical protein